MAHPPDAAQPQPAQRRSETAHPVVLFDGICNFCNATVNFLLDKDTAGVLRFAALQSKAGQNLLEACGLPAADFDSIVLMQDGRSYVKSGAVLRIVWHLPLPWKLAAVFLAVPGALRDYVYGVIARHRYRWFGKRESCRVPSAEVRARFLADPE